LQGAPEIHLWPKFSQCAPLRATSSGKEQCISSANPKPLKTLCLWKNFPGRICQKLGKNYWSASPLQELCRSRLWKINSPNFPGSSETLLAKLREVAEVPGDPGRPRRVIKLEMTSARS